MSDRVVEANGHKVPAESYQSALESWGRSRFRPFPWRLTTDAYRILMAEVMLHRTQASQVVPVYVCFIEQFPDVTSLARASREDLGEALVSLGLLWRIDLIYQMAETLAMRFGGRVPQEKAELLSLPGVSQYIAAAVRCFSWNLPDPIIDTNTVRVRGAAIWA